MSASWMLCRLMQSLLFGWGFALKPKEGRTGSFCNTDDGAWTLEWHDDFEGDHLDMSSWQIVTSQGGYHGIDLPVAGLNVTACRSAMCRAKNVVVSGGLLRLLSEQDENDKTRYYSAAVTTKDRVSWSAEPAAFRVCVRAKLPLNSKGVWPAHWMLPQNGYSDQCLDEGEMDITEMVSSDGTVYNTYHWMSSWPGQRCANFDSFHKSVASFRRLRSYSSEFHEYSVERSMEHISFAIDGRVQGRFRADEKGFQLSASPFFLILNTAIGGGWPGPPVAGETHMPVEHLIDWVRVVRATGDSGTASAQVIGTGFQVSREIRTHQS